RMMLAHWVRQPRQAAARPVRIRLLAAAIAMALVPGVVEGTAQADIQPASVSIEGDWHYKGGQVAVRKQPDGSFRGTIVRPTVFERCHHETGELLWTGITAQPDGSYFGLHQWFFDASRCPRNPTLGLTGFRVLRHGNAGQPFLRVCLSEP